MSHERQEETGFEFRLLGLIPGATSGSTSVLSFHETEPISIPNECDVEHENKNDGSGGVDPRLGLHGPELMSRISHART